MSLVWRGRRTKFLKEEWRRVHDAKLEKEQFKKRAKTNGIAREKKTIKIGGRRKAIERP